MWDEVFEDGDPVVAVVAGDADGDGSGEEPELIGVHGGVRVRLVQP